ncbi:MBL fold metallo-hydrolase [bacterium]|nr:MBL fold metallo-hydrolase [bacterium]
MRELFPRLFQSGYEHEYGIGWCYLIVGETSLIMVDPGFGWHFRPGTGLKTTPAGNMVRSESLITPNLLDLLLFSQSMKKTIRYCLLTHSHSDHTQNMELLMQKSDEINSYFNQKLVDFQLIVHQNSAFRRPVFKRIENTVELDLEGHVLEFVPTPGHSSTQDDMSIFMKEQSILFCGDLCQPQGRDYHICEGPSPIPFFCNGDLARNSLKKLMTYDFHCLLTAHGYQYNRTDGLNALRLTHALLERIDTLSQTLSQEHPNEHPDHLSLWVYDTITHERQFNREKAEFRKVHFDRNGISDFQKYDKITIDFFIAKYKHPQSKTDGREY